MLNNKYKDKRIFSVILLIFVFCLSIGLALFSSSLNIKSTTTVSPSKDNFKLIATCTYNGTGDCEVTPTSDDPVLAEKSSKAVIENTTNGMVIRNLNFYLTKPGDKIKYSFYVRNNGQYTAYMKNYGVRNVEGTQKVIKCTPGEGTSESMVSSFCSGFSLFLNFSTGASSSSGVMYGGAWERDLNSSLPMSPNSYRQVSIELTYSTSSSVVRVDGPLTVEMGEMYINYSSVPNS